MTIGYLLDATGRGAFLGRQSRAGAELAALELRRSGLDIKLLFGDHRSDSKTAVTEAQRLTRIDQADAVACDLTATCVAASPVVREAGRLFLYQSPAASILDTNPHAFRNFLDYELGCRTLALRLKHDGARKVANLKANAEYGELCLKGSSQVFPDQTEIAYESNDDMKTIVLKLKSTGFDTVIQTGFEGDYINQFLRSAELHYEPRIGMPQPVLTEAVRKAIGPAVNRITLFGFQSVAPDFVDRLKKEGLYVEEGNLEAAAVGYTFVTNAARSISGCPKGDIECTVDAFSKLPVRAIEGFKMWKTRRAAYDFGIKRWEAGAFRILDSLPETVKK